MLHSFLAHIVQKPQRGGPERIYYAIRTRQRPHVTIEWLGRDPSPERIRRACRRHGVRIARQPVPEK